MGRDRRRGRHRPGRLRGARRLELSRSYFVGVQPDGHVAVYQGFPWNVVGGVKLYRMRYESPVLAGQLSQPERRTLFDHDLRTYDRALDTVKQYEAQVVP